MFLEGFLDSLTANQILHAFLILSAGNAHQADGLLDHVR